MRLVPRFTEASEEDMALCLGIDTKFFHIADIAFKPWSVFVQEVFEVDGGDLLDLANVGPDEKAFEAL